MNQKFSTIPITLKSYSLKGLMNLPIYTSEGKPIRSFYIGRKIDDCVHEDQRSAEKCYHDSYDWDNAEKVLIMEESL